ncbi:uncharacterized protein LOC127809517 [Diospyros lotus]|uniref:uncharacterized protein LOC127809517 n=1 Tax=Diospyros lotus TaxID=55363 RepID=UPI00224D0DEE|nr:uncharacterized protein LOC127809517 [Diospyros lotus]
MESENGKDSEMQTAAAAGTSRDNSYPVIRVGASHSSSSSASDKDGAISDDSLSKIGLMSPEEAAAAAGQTPQWSMVSMSPRSGPGPMSSAEYSPHYDWGKLCPSPRQSPPPMQTMGRTSEEGGGYDPNRIPSAVFSGKPATPMEWSVASNESLFSIHMGNNSFSRDNAILKSGELTKSGELMINFNKSGRLPASESNSDELKKSPSSLPTVIKAPDDKTGLPPPATPVKGTAELDHNNSSSKNPAVQHSLSKASDGTCTSANTPRLSDDSGNSCHSFAFPILMGEEGRNVSVKVPPTNDLQANASHKKAAAVAEEQQPPAGEAGQTAAAAGTPKAPNETKWFSCFSCRFPCF